MYHFGKYLGTVETSSKICLQKLDHVLHSVAMAWSDTCTQNICLSFKLDKFSD